MTSSRIQLLYLLPVEIKGNLTSAIVQIVNTIVAGKIYNRLYLHVYSRRSDSSESSARNFAPVQKGSVAVTLYVQSRWCPVLYMCSCPLRYAANYGAGQILVPVRTARHQYGTACELSRKYVLFSLKCNSPTPRCLRHTYPKFTSYVNHTIMHRTSDPITTPSSQLFLLFSSFGLQIRTRLQSDPDTVVTARTARQRDDECVT